MRRVAIVVGPALFVEAMLYAVLAPLLPRYVDELGLSASAAGLLTASFAAGSVVMALPGGSLAARLGGRRTLAIGVGGLIVASLAFAFSHHVVLLDGARFIQGAAGSVLWAGGLTWASDAAAASRQATTIGALIGSGIAGAPFGPLLGGLAVATSPTLVFLAVAAALLPLLATVLVSPDAPRSPTAGAPLSRALRRPHRRATVRAVALTLIPSIGFGLIFVLAPLRLAAAGASAGAITVTFVIASAVDASANPISGRLTDRCGARAILVRALPAATVAFAIFALPLSVPLLGLVTALSLGCLGFAWVPLTVGLQRAIGDAGSGEGHAFALFNMSWAGGQAIGAAGGAALAQGAGYAAPSLATSVLVGGAAVAVARAPAEGPHPHPHGSEPTKAIEEVGRG
ncbi:MAG: MFS transporter [Actinobacteria bacterium]|nr:MFS transporter [Actinomycetota bacterium]